LLSPVGDRLSAIQLSAPESESGGRATAGRVRNICLLPTGSDDARIVVEMDPQFQELASQIAREVTANVTKAVTENVTKAVTDNLTAHVSEAVSAAEERLSRHARIHAEAIAAEARMVADNYGGVLQSIDSRLSHLESGLRQEFAHYNAVLDNHNTRITALENDGS
jgi:hypothetical protein